MYVSMCMIYMYMCDVDMPVHIHSTGSTHLSKSAKLNVAYRIASQ